MTAPRRVNYNGASLTLRQLAAATGQTYACLYGRYRKGDREPELWRAARMRRRQQGRVAVVISRRGGERTDARSGGHEARGEVAARAG